MSHKTFLIIGLLAITNLLTVLALSVTQRGYSTLQSQAAQRQLPMMMKSSIAEPDGTDDMATINSNDFSVDESTATDDQLTPIPADTGTDPVQVDDQSLNSVSGDDFSSGF